MIEDYSRDLVRAVLQEVLEALRRDIRAERLTGEALSRQLDALEPVLESKLRSRLQSSLRQAINATGVIIHTNVGRAPLSPQAAQAMVDAATGYSNLEYDFALGRRGHRDAHLEPVLCRLLGCQAATVANNNAAALLLILNTLALGRKVLVSRGELVEIGGSFRIPAIMERSGAVLKEVGTTNKTKLADYREAVDDQTALILRVHPSNYRIVGFTHRPQLEELTALAAEKKIPLVEDEGSGHLFPSSHSFLEEEPSVQTTLATGVDLVCFSGDKLLGGPQAGVIVGRKDLVDAVRSNPLMRACRVDKVRYAALAWTLACYETGRQEDHVPVHQMLSATADQIESRARRLACLIDPRTFRVLIRPGASLIGGGAAPEREIPTSLLAVTSAIYSVNEMERRLRQQELPILTRIEDEQLILDLRTVFPPQEEIIASAFSGMAAGH